LLAFAFALSPFAFGAATAAAEPQAAEIVSSFSSTPFDESAVLGHDLVHLLALNTVFTLHRAPRATRLELFQGPAPDASNAFGTPTVLYARCAGGVHGFTPGARLAGTDLQSPGCC